MTSPRISEQDQPCRAVKARLRPHGADSAPGASGTTTDTCSFALNSESPILACSLGGADHAERITRWRSSLDFATLAHRPLGVTACLPVELIREIADLVVAEQQCCPFLGFDITFSGSTVELAIAAPNEAALPFMDTRLPRPSR